MLKYATACGSSSMLLIGNHISINCLSKKKNLQHQKQYKYCNAMCLKYFMGKFIVLITSSGGSKENDSKLGYTISCLLTK